MREVPVRMPKFSMAQEEGLLISWHKQPGDSVAAGELLCEVATDKVDMEVESPVSGTLTRLLADPKQSVPVGEPIAMMETDADDLLEGLLDDPPAPTVATPDHDGAIAENAANGRDLSHATAPSRKGRQPAMPGARRRASELGLNLSELNGTGKGGVITLHDVEAAARRSQPEPTAATTSPAEPAPQTAQRAEPVPTQPSRSPQPSQGSLDPQYADALDGRRRSIRMAVARRMTESAAIPQFTVYADLDLDLLASQRHGIGWTTWLTRALALTARAHDPINTLWTEAGPQPQTHVGVAMAVDTPVGLLAPVLRDPDLIEPSALDQLIRRTVDRARNGKLTPADLEGGTITLSNLGGFGIHAFQALLTPPQAAALSVGGIAAQPVVDNGGLRTGLRCRVGLTIDHRAADGADAARFLADLQTLLAEPSRLRAQTRTARAIA